MQIITVDETKCMGCNACVRVCPVQANITMLREKSNTGFITVVDQKACIQCGECVKVCKHGARDYVDDLDKFIDEFEGGEHLTLIVAPSIRTSFPVGAWKILLHWLRENGNVKIYDVGYGADICTYMHNKYIEQNPGCKILTQPCPAVVNYVQKYKNELIHNLSPILSPAGCLAVWLKKYKHDNNKIYMLSPCIAKTSEARRENAFDGNVTFKKLEEYVNSRGINWSSGISTAPFNFDDTEGGIGRMYPMPGGLRETLQMLNNGLVIRTAEGSHTLYDRLIRYADTIESKKPDVLDVLNCEFGCNHGPAIPEQAASILEVENIMDEISAQSIQELKGGFLGFGKMKRFKEFDKSLNLDDFLTSYKKKPVERKMPTDEQLNAIYMSMLKKDKASREIDCMACGYNSCEEMACAIYCGLSVKENCAYFLRKSLKYSYAKMKKMYDTCVAEIGNINRISIEIQKSSDSAASSSDDINEKAANLSNNISRLQKLCETCLNYYQNKSIATLTEDDIVKMKKLITAIGGMSAGYNDIACEFEQTSTGIRHKVADISRSVTKLTKLSGDLYTYVGGNTGLQRPGQADKGKKKKNKAQAMNADVVFGADDFSREYSDPDDFDKYENYIDDDDPLSVYNRYY